MPLNAISVYVIEKHCREVYKEDCMWLTARQYIAEDKLYLFKQPHLRHAEPQRHTPAQAPYRTKEQTVDFIFEGL